MDRRELLKWIAAITGTAVIGGEFLLTGCRSGEEPAIGLFTENDISFLDEVAESIIPRTDTPGAKDAGVGRFMASYSTACYNEAQQKTMKDGIRVLDNAAKSKFSRDFPALDTEQREELLTVVDAEAKRYNSGQEKQPSGEQLPHYFTLMKQLALFGFFTSKPGMTEVLRYEPVPGKYQGCIDYKQGQTSWA